MFIGTQRLGLYHWRYPALQRFQILQREPCSLLSLNPVPQRTALDHIYFLLGLGEDWPTEPSYTNLVYCPELRDFSRFLEHTRLKPDTLTIFIPHPGSSCTPASDMLLQTIFQTPSAFCQRSKICIYLITLDLHLTLDQDQSQVQQPQESKALETVTPHNAIDKADTAVSKTILSLTTDSLTAIYTLPPIKPGKEDYDKCNNSWVPEPSYTFPTVQTVFLCLSHAAQALLDKRFVNVIKGPATGGLELQV